MTFKRFATAALFAVSAIGFAQEEAPDAPLSNPADHQAGEAPYVPGEILIQFKKGAGNADLHRAENALNGKAAEHLQTPLMKKQGHEGLFRVKVGKDVKEAIKQAKKDPSVLYAEPNYIVQAGHDSNDPIWTNGNLWGMAGATTGNPFGSQAAELWKWGSIGHKKIHVGVIDEGVEVRHPDLVNNVWRNEADPIDGLDNDGNGYIDDYWGWDFVSNNNSVYDGTQDNHGTHVAGTIGARGGNGKGVAGVAWYVTMIPVKFLGDEGGTVANAIKAMDYLTDMKFQKGIDLVATNNSWGGGGFSQALKDAIWRAGVAKILVVAAAGNGGEDKLGDDTDLQPHYPSAYDNWNIISVAALDSSGALGSFSNFGATTVDVAAPGVGIYSTVPGSGYGSYSGTSMATPHVSGALAIWAARTQERGWGLKHILMYRNTYTPSLAGKVVKAGRLNIAP
jgi:subtilisin family serine protease